MRPAQQGIFDKFCGAYAIVNALELVGVTGRRSTLHSDLFEKILLALPPNRLRAGVVCGLEAADLVAASRKAFRWLRRTHGVDLQIRLPFADLEFQDTSAFVDVLRAQSDQWRRAVIIGVEFPGGEHWTVVRTIEGRRLYVRDCSGLKYLDLERYHPKHGRYRFVCEDTLVIQRRI